jgi:glycolate oxidase
MMGCPCFVRQIKRLPALTLRRLSPRVRAVNTVDASFIQSLQAIFSPERVLTSAEDIVPYSFDGTAALKQRPGAVVFPLTAAKKSPSASNSRANERARRHAWLRHRLSGGSVPLDGCLVICLVKMDKLIEVDEKNLTLRAQSGVITKEIDDAAPRSACFIRRTPVR